jgi:hypothetical protein
MRKLALILACCAWIPSCWQPLRGQGVTGPIRSKAGGSPNTITVAKLPSVSIDRDWIDYSTLVLGIVLAVAGIAGIIVAVCTLRDVEKQTKATQRSVDVLINSERAWVLVRPIHAELKPVTNDSVMPYNQFRFTMINRGKTVARLIKYQADGYLARRDSVWDDMPSYEGTPSANFGSMAIGIHTLGVFAPDEPNDMAIAINERLTFQRLAEIAQGNLILRVLGRIEYFDFAEKPRVIQFCYQYVAYGRDFDGNLVYWVLAGPEAYNTST